MNRREQVRPRNVDGARTFVLPVFAPHASAGHAGVGGVDGIGDAEVGRVQT
ncbi:hypothetical protein [Streptomyces sp. NPDC055186]